MRKKEAYLMVAHGSRDPEMPKEFSALISELKTKAGRTAVSGAYLEILKPNVGDALERLVSEGYTSIVVLPLILFSGKHSRSQLPAILADKKLLYPSIDFHLAPHLFHQKAFREALLKALQEKSS